MLSRIQTVTLCRMRKGRGSLSGLFKAGQTLGLAPLPGFYFGFRPPRQPPFFNTRLLVKLD